LTLHTRTKAFLPAMTSSEIGPHRIAVPDKRLSRNLTDWCPACLEPTEPTAVLHEASEGTGQITGLTSAHQCACGYRWLCWWSPAMAAR
jgi:hypothetical protein